MQLQLKKIQYSFGKFIARHNLETMKNGASHDASLLLFYARITKIGTPDERIAGSSRTWESLVSSQAISIRRRPFSYGRTKMLDLVAVKNDEKLRS